MTELGPDGQPNVPEPTPPTRPDIISDKTANRVIWIVTVVWAMNMLVAMFGELVGLEYEPPETVNGIFMTIVGGAFILRARARGGGD